MASTTRIIRQQMHNNSTANHSSVKAKPRNSYDTK